MSALFTDYIKILGKGRHGSRSLTEAEAEAAMSLILKGQVAPEQLGAFWMLIRIREETIAEAAGFTRAVRQYLRDKHIQPLTVDLDWPAYAGKRNELPWFLLAAFALAQSGINIAMHGHTFAEEERVYVEEVIRWFGIATAANYTEAEHQLKQHRFTYLPLTDIAPELAELMNLKRLLGLRSPVNTVVRLMNPTIAKHSVHGVFHKGYDEIHIGAAKALGDTSVLVFRGGNGEAEVNPERDVSLGLLQQSHRETQPESRVVNEYWSHWSKATAQHIRQKNNLDFTRLQQHWTGEKNDEFGELAILNTMAPIIGMLQGQNHLTDHKEENLNQAQAIWESRNKEQIL